MKRIWYGMVVATTCLAVSIPAAQAAVSAGPTCNGKSDDTATLQNAISKSSGSIVKLPAGTCSISRPLLLSGHVSLGGASFSKSILNLNGSGSLVISGDNNSISNLTLRRNTSTDQMVMINVKASKGLLIDHTLIDGQRSKFGTSQVHGLRLDETNGGAITGVTMRYTTVTETDYGLFQSNDNTSTVNGFVVDHCLFTKNHKDDLEFNSPNGHMSNVTVRNSKFLTSAAPPADPSAGFGVGLANVQSATVSGNTFMDYPLVPLHIEDRSSNVLVTGNKFSNSGTFQMSYSSHIFIINKSRNISIKNNTFDARANTDQFSAVYASTGGGAGPPANINVSNNVFSLNSKAKKTALYDTVGATGSDLS